MGRVYIKGIRRWDCEWEYDCSKGEWEREWEWEWRGGKTDTRAPALGDGDDMAIVRRQRDRCSRIAGM